MINVKDPASPKLMSTVEDGFYKDVIPYDNLLICYLSTGLQLYDISNLHRLKNSVRFNINAAIKAGYIN